MNTEFYFCHVYFAMYYVCIFEFLKSAIGKTCLNVFSNAQKCHCVLTLGPCRKAGQELVGRVERHRVILEMVKNLQVPFRVELLRDELPGPYLHLSVVLQLQTQERSEHQI